MDAPLLKAFLAYGLRSWHGPKNLPVRAAGVSLRHSIQSTLSDPTAHVPATFEQVCPYFR